MRHKLLIMKFSIVALLVSTVVYAAREISIARELKRKEAVLSMVKEEISKTYLANKAPSSSIVHDEKTYDIKYSNNEKLEKHIRKLLRRFRSDYSAVVVIDNGTGAILAAEGYDGVNKKFARSLAFSSTHPAASIFKIVTSAELLEADSVDGDSVFRFHGKGTTLYKGQLKDRKTKWDRKQSFEKAFAFSNNVIFGKAAIENTSPANLFKTATSFGFNKNLMSDIDLTPSFFPVADSKYNLAELATGFNKKTLISTVHAAHIASVVANQGVGYRPRLVLSVQDNELDEPLWEYSMSPRDVLPTDTALELQELMNAVVRYGTGRGSFRRLNRFMKNHLDVGGKTGSITGGVPMGKRDWFVMYAKPKNEIFGKGISLAVMNVNIEKWRVRSTYFAKKIIEYYYKDIIPLKQQFTEYKSKQRNIDG